MRILRAGEPTSTADLERLWHDAIDPSTPRDWSFGYPDQWDFWEAPEGAVWDESSQAWKRDGDEIEASYEEGCEGPMMNYSYQLPVAAAEVDAHIVAEALRDIPLCLVYFDYTQEYALALTGGGMDLSWEICEAFIRLGFLPPAMFADLPGMAGYPRGADDETIIAACKRTFEVRAFHAARALERLDRLGKEVPA